MTEKKPDHPDSRSSQPGEQMLAFLSKKWFEKVVECARVAPEPAGETFVVEQIVEGTPEGTVRYRVQAAGGISWVAWPVPADASDPDLTVTCHWDAALEIASGRLIAGQALLDGKLRVRGNPSSILLADGAEFADPLPAEVRRITNFAPGG